MLHRLLSDNLKKCKKSILLLGPRQTGKTTLIKSLKPDLTINLADEADYISYQGDYELLKKTIAAKKPRTVFIDEIQRIPSLTNTIQALIDENPNLKFYLTGSSARKLKRGNANLLPGRIVSFSIGGLSLAELNYDLDTNSALSYGLLPGIYTESDIKTKKQVLRTYSVSYLKEEIQSEALVRSIPNFVRFINEAAKTSGQFLDYSKLSQRAKVPRESSRRLFEILEDTMVAYRITPDPEVEDLVKHSRYYFFDTGVLNGLLGNFIASADRIGMLFEHLVVTQIMNSNFAQDKDFQMHTFRTRGGLEIDLIVKSQKKIFGIEIKATQNLHTADYKTPLRFKDAYPKEIEVFIAHNGTREEKYQSVWGLPWQKVIKEIGL